MGQRAQQSHRTWALWASASSSVKQGHPLPDALIRAFIRLPFHLKAFDSECALYMGSFVWASVCLPCQCPVRSSTVPGTEKALENSRPREGLPAASPPCHGEQPGLAAAAFPASRAPARNQS